MLGLFLGIRAEFGFERVVLDWRLAPRPRAGQRPHADFATRELGENLRRRTDDGMSFEIEKVHVRGGIRDAERLVQCQRRSRDRKLEPLREHHLENVAGSDVLLGALDVGFELGAAHVGLQNPHPHPLSRKAGEGRSRRSSPLSRLCGRGDGGEGVFERLNYAVESFRLRGLALQAHCRLPHLMIEHHNLIRHQKIAIRQAAIRPDSCPAAARTAARCRTPDSRRHRRQTGRDHGRRDWLFTISRSTASGSAVHRSTTSVSLDLDVAGRDFAR